VIKETAIMFFNVRMISTKVIYSYLNRKFYFNQLNVNCEQ